MDADEVCVFKDFGAAVAIDSKGRLLMGGVSDPDNVFKKLGAKLWDGSLPHPPKDLGVVATGPVAFAYDGTPLQLAVDKQEKSLTLMTWRPRADPAFGCARRAGDRRWRRAFPSHDVAGWHPRGGGGAQADGRYQAIVWDGQTGRELARVTVDAHCLAISPDAKLLATGDRDGNVTVWSLESKNSLFTWPCRRMRINTVAFGRSPLLTHDGPNSSMSRWRWQLAAGDAGGTITVWDIAPETARVRAPSVATNTACSPWPFRRTVRCWLRLDASASFGIPQRASSSC